ncbi:MAG: hypothetical protein AAB728_03860, partial [Patescibacteria group bacterium]
LVLDAADIPPDLPIIFQKDSQDVNASRVAYCPASIPSGGNQRGILIALGRGSLVVNVHLAKMKEPSMDLRKFRSVGRGIWLQMTGERLVNSPSGT